jgi:hypothetical protein
LQLTHVDKLLHIFDNVEEAVSGLSTRA